MADTTILAAPAIGGTVQLKLIDNGDGTYSFQSVPAATEKRLGAVGGTTAVATATPTVSTTAYASGDVIGAKLTFANIGRVAAGTGLIQDVTILCKSAQTFACDLVLFKADPTNSTFTDNAALAVHASDLPNVIGAIPISTWTNLGTPSIAQASQLARAYALASGVTSMFGVLVSRGTPNLASTSDITVVVKALQD